MGEERREEIISAASSNLHTSSLWRDKSKGKGRKVTQYSQTVKELDLRTFYSTEGVRMIPIQISVNISCECFFGQFRLYHIRI